MQGRGIYYDDSGSAYEGLWVKGLRQGHGQQAYIPEGSDGFSNDVYDGDWDQDNRSESLCIRPAQVALSMSGRRCSTPFQS